ncbi:MAG: malonic semialdehyde reductase [Myxococcales bacterium]|nr:malonic semialdehyde reductase [Myxococcales bacterium]
MRSPLSDDALAQLFLSARTHNVWQARPVEDGQLQRIYELARMAPTAANSQPLRVVFVKSPEAKARLRPALSAGNVDKTMAAPVTAIVAFDTAFHEHMGTLFPHNPGTGAAMTAMAEPARTTFLYRNGSLQGAYLMLAARALGLDCGPMSGFDAAKVDAAFFADGRWRSNFLCNLGYGDDAKVHPRAPRLDFADACRIE